ncbi:MAG: hypothetical protein R3D67_17835 [Hyphomicrobiaceae bacterium]
MRLHLPSLVTHTVKQQGHAPLLRDRPTMLAINAFLAKSDHGAMSEPAAHQEVA